MKSASIGGAAVSALASLSSSGTDATSGHSSLPPKGFFPPVQFAELEAEYQRTHAVKINSLSKAKGSRNRKANEKNSVSAAKRKRTDAALGHSQKEAKNRKMSTAWFSRAPETRVPKNILPGSMEDEVLLQPEYKRQVSVSEPVFLNEFFIPPTHIPSILCAWDFLHLQSNTFGFKKRFSIHELIVAMRSRAGSELLDTIFVALLKVLYRLSDSVTPDQEHLVITSLTWPHYLLNWLQSRDTLDAEDFVDVIDFLIHSSFYALSIPRRFDVLFSIVDEVNSSPQLKKVFATNLVRMHEIKSKLYREKVKAGKDERSYRNDSLMQKDTAMCLAMLMDKVVEQSGESDKMTWFRYSIDIDNRETQQRNKLFTKQKSEREAIVAEEMEALSVRTTPIGSDRHFRQYFRLAGCKDILFSRSKDNEWCKCILRSAHPNQDVLNRVLAYLNSLEAFNQLLQWLDVRGKREFALHHALSSMKWSFPSASAPVVVSVELDNDNNVEEKRQTRSTTNNNAKDEGASPYYSLTIAKELSLLRASKIIAGNASSSHTEYVRCRLCQEDIGSSERHCRRCHATIQIDKSMRMFEEHVLKCSFDESIERRTDLRHLSPFFHCVKALLLDLEAAVPIDACVRNERSEADVNAERRVWVDSCKLATTVQDLAQLLVPIERGVLRAWLKPWFRRKEWRDELLRCQNVHSFAACLFTLDKALLYLGKQSSGTTSPKAMDESGSDGSERGCEGCGRSSQPQKLLICDSCENEWHMFCLEPALAFVPINDWFCPACEAKRGKSDSVVKPEEEVNDCLTSASALLAQTSVNELNEATEHLLPSLLPQSQRGFELDAHRIVSQTTSEQMSTQKIERIPFCFVCDAVDTKSNLISCVSCDERAHKSCISSSALVKGATGFVCVACRRRSQEHKQEEVKVKVATP